MNPLSRQQCRDIDRYAIGGLGIPGAVLMENAGRGTVDALLRHDPTCRTVLVLCGKGNNGGDGFVIARHLAIRGIAVTTVLLAKGEELSGDALLNYSVLKNSEMPIAEFTDESNLTVELSQLAEGCDWIVDALLGTGATGEPREPYGTAIAWMNAQKAKRLAVDVPSGLDCDTGNAASKTVHADLTCTFVAMKIGYEPPLAKDYLGLVEVISIGIPPQAIGKGQAESMT